MRVGSTLRSYRYSKIIVLCDVSVAIDSLVELMLRPALASGNMYLLSPTELVGLCGALTRYSAGGLDASIDGLARSTFVAVVGEAEIRRLRLSFDSADASNNGMGESFGVIVGTSQLSQALSNADRFITVRERGVLEQLLNRGLPSDSTWL